MGKRVQLREVTDDERHSVKRLAHLRTAPARAVERVRDVEAALQGAGGRDRGECGSAGPGSRHRLVVATPLRSAWAGGASAPRQWA
jgi:hypothetical protein